jgi:hypothetical protein
MVLNTRVKRALSGKKMGVTPVSYLKPGINTSLTPVLTRQNPTREVGLAESVCLLPNPKPVVIFFLQYQCFYHLFILPGKTLKKYINIKSNYYQFLNTVPTMSIGSPPPILTF